MDFTLGILCGILVSVLAWMLYSERKAGLAQRVTFAIERERRRWREEQERKRELRRSGTWG
jgi:hypothetical protein